MEICLKCRITIEVLVRIILKSGAWLAAEAASAGLNWSPYYLALPKSDLAQKAKFCTKLHKKGFIATTAILSICVVVFSVAVCFYVYGIFGANHFAGVSYKLNVIAKRCYMFGGAWKGIKIPCPAPEIEVPFLGLGAHEVLAFDMEIGGLANHIWTQGKRARWLWSDRKIEIVWKFINSRICPYIETNIFCKRPSAIRPTCFESPRHTIARGVNERLGSDIWRRQHGSLSVYKSGVNNQFLPLHQLLLILSDDIEPDRVKGNYRGGDGHDPIGKFLVAEEFCDLFLIIVFTFGLVWLGGRLILRGHSRLGACVSHCGGMGGLFAIYWWVIYWRLCQ